MTPATLNYSMNGLLAVVVQHHESGQVLMVGFANEAAVRKTVETGHAWFFSRSRKRLWEKGESSGNRLRVITAFTDCDQDTLLFQVVVEGDGLVCHEGTVSCFTRPVAMDASVEVSA